jgi:hypothetical protein
VYPSDPAASSGWPPNAEYNALNNGTSPRSAASRTACAVSDADETARTRCEAARFEEAVAAPGSDEESDNRGGSSTTSDSVELSGVEVERVGLLSAFPIPYSS